MTQNFDLNNAVFNTESMRKAVASFKESPQDKAARIAIWKIETPKNAPTFADKKNVDASLTYAVRYESHPANPSIFHVSIIAVDAVGQKTDSGIKPIGWTRIVRGSKGNTFQQTDSQGMPKKTMNLTSLRIAASAYIKALTRMGSNELSGDIGLTLTDEELELI